MWRPGEEFFQSLSLVRLAKKVILFAQSFSFPDANSVGLIADRKPPRNLAKSWVPPRKVISSLNLSSAVSVDVHIEDVVVRDHKLVPPDER